MILRLKETKKSKSGSMKADISVEIDDVCKLFTRTYMQDGDASIDLDPLDRESVAEALSDALDFDAEIVWCDGLWRFMVCWQGNKHEKPPEGIAWDRREGETFDVGYHVKWGTVEEIKAALPPRVVGLLNNLNEIKEIKVRMQ
jgi:hypothetical protein